MKNQKYKDQPDGIILTLPTAFFIDREMTTDNFKTLFERQLRNEETVWNFKLTNLPTMDVLFVYILFDRQIQYRANLVQYQRNVSKVFRDSPDENIRTFPNCNWVIFTGPLIKPPHEIPMKGFQGFRYTHQIF